MDAQLQVINIAQNADTVKQPNTQNRYLDARKNIAAKVQFQENRLRKLYMARLRGGNTQARSAGEGRRKNKNAADRTRSRKRMHRLINETF